jgi:hypothetical protein
MRPLENSKPVRPAGQRELDHRSELLTIACVARSYRASHLPAKAKQGRSAVDGGFVVLALPQSAM